MLSLCVVNDECECFQEQGFCLLFQWNVVYLNGKFSPLNLDVRHTFYAVKQALKNYFVFNIRWPHLFLENNFLNIIGRFSQRV